MKLILVLLCVGLSACAHTAAVTPRTDLTPIHASNVETRKAIKSSQTHIETSQVEAKKGEDSLEEAKVILEGLLRE